MSSSGWGQAECQSCHALYPRSELDRYLWCPDCATSAARGARRWGRVTALATAVALVLWIVLAARPGPQFRIFWVAPVLVTYLLVARIAQTIAMGVYRSRGVEKQRG